MGDSAGLALGEGGEWTARTASTPRQFKPALLGPEVILPEAGPRTDIANPAAPPFAAIGLLNLFSGDALVLVGTGFCVEPDIFVTARHNLTTTAYDSAGVWMAYDRQSNPDVPPQRIAAFATHRTLDLAIFVLAYDQPTVTGLGDPVAAGSDVEIAGYGYATALGKPRFTVGHGKVANADAASLSYIISTREGDSGAPVIAFQDGHYKAVGLHLEGQKAGGHGNRGLVFSPAVAADLRVLIDWARQQRT